MYGNRTLTASKLINESIAEDAALLSATFASRRNCVLWPKLRKDGVPQTKAYRQDVVRIVNHVYAAKVTAVMAAKSQPNLYDWNEINKASQENKRSHQPRYRIQVISRVPLERCEKGWLATET